MNRMKVLTMIITELYTSIVCGSVFKLDGLIGADIVFVVQNFVVKLSH